MAPESKACTSGPSSAAAPGLGLAAALAPDPLRGQTWKLTPTPPFACATVCSIWGYRIFTCFCEDFLQGGAWRLVRKPGSLQNLNQRVSLGRYEPSILGVHIYTDVPDTGG